MGPCGFSLGHTDPNLLLSLGWCGAWGDLSLEFRA